MIITTRPLWLVCLLAVLTTIGFYEIASQRKPYTPPRLAVQWSPSLHLSNRSDIPRRLNQRFGDIFTGTAQGVRVTISNCTDYLYWSNQGFTGLSDQEANILHNDAVDCTALNILKTAEPAQATFFQNFELTPDSLSLLPPELAPAVSETDEAAAMAASQAGKSWKAYIPTAQASIEKNTSSVEVRQPGWITRLTEYGRGDFTGTKNQQLLIRADYIAREGTYGNSKLFILGRNSYDGPLVLIKEVPIP